MSMHSVNRSSQAASNCLRLTVTSSLAPARQTVRTFQLLGSIPVEWPRLDSRIHGFVLLIYRLLTRQRPVTLVIWGALTR